ncbi:hypothetical protein M758_5G134000 [Ceratodon purpureus]|uniref:Uncharacterized protein n=1 Tax=Ceratodon purpureus TaxID=3225 RepID=A0A8T0I2N7_CERPU|nr:hypothetical protein KC19_5G139800 [Ceratodon purpureus]KAG0616681.1 hypothetical protein M758_5G134000 [Ceratodon purpureus]
MGSAMAKLEHYVEVIVMSVFVRAQTTELGPFFTYTILYQGQVESQSIPSCAFGCEVFGLESTQQSGRLGELQCVLRRERTRCIRFNLPSAPTSAFPVSS